MHGKDQQQLRRWDRLSADEQLALRESYGRHMDAQTPTSDLELKLEHFRRWLAERSVAS